MDRLNKCCGTNIKTGHHPNCSHILPEDVLLSDPIEETIAKRDESYGKYEDQAGISMDLIDIMINSPNWYDIDKAKRQSLMMIQLKIGRLLNGNPNHTDSWHDIGGYAKLAEDTCDLPVPILKTHREDESWLLCLRKADGSSDTNITSDDVIWTVGKNKLIHENITYQYQTDGTYHEVIQTISIPNVDQRPGEPG